MKRLTLTALALIPGMAMAASHSAEGDDTQAMTTEQEVQAQAEGDAAAMDSETMMADAKLIRSRDIVGGEVYSMADTSGMDWSDATTFDSIGADWTDIGEIEDIVLDENGAFKGIVAEVRGCLEIGDKHVMLTLDDVKFAPVDDKTYAVVVRQSLEELKSMEGVDEGFWE